MGHCWLLLVKLFPAAKSKWNLKHMFRSHRPPLVSGLTELCGVVVGLHPDNSGRSRVHLHVLYMNKIYHSLLNICHLHIWSTEPSIGKSFNLLVILCGEEKPAGYHRPFAECEQVDFNVHHSSLLLTLSQYFRLFRNLKHRFYHWWVNRQTLDITA